MHHLFLTNRGPVPQMDSSFSHEGAPVSDDMGLRIVAVFAACQCVSDSHCSQHDFFTAAQSKSNTPDVELNPQPSTLNPKP